MFHEVTTSTYYFIVLICLVGCGPSRDSKLRNAPLSFSQASLLTLPLHHIKGEVQVGTTIVPNDPDLSDTPALMLAEAVKRDPTAQHFRVSWDMTAGIAACQSTALYGRRQHMIKLFCKGYKGQGPAYAPYQRLFCIQPVSDKALFVLARWERSPSGLPCTQDIQRILRGSHEVISTCSSDFGGFSKLTAFGAKITLVSDVTPQH